MANDPMLEMFIFENVQLTERLEEILIECERLGAFTEDHVSEIFRIMHTIKGSSAMMNFTVIAEASHRIEDLFYYLREENPQKIDYSNMNDLIFECIDFIKEQLEKIQNNQSNFDNPSDIVNKLENFLKDIKGKKADGSTPVAPVAAAPSAPASPSPSSSPKTKPAAPTAKKAKPADDENDDESFSLLHFYTATIFFDPGSEMENVRAYAVINNNKEDMNNVSYDIPDLTNEASADIIREHGFIFDFSSKLNYDEMHALLSQTIYLYSLELTELSIKEISKPDLNFYEAHIWFDDDCEMENVRSYTVVHKLNENADYVEHTPKDLIDPESSDVIKKNGLKLEIITTKLYEELYDELLNTIYLKNLSLEQKDFNELEDKMGFSKAFQTTDSKPKTKPKAVPAQAADAAPAAEPETPAVTVTAPPETNIIEKNNDNMQVINVIETKTDTPAAIQEQAKSTTKSVSPTLISVNVGKLDVGELVIAEAMVTQNPELENIELDGFHKEARQLRQIIKGLQDTVMTMRMVSLTNTFVKMNRVVRDICKTTGKDVQLEIVGDTTEVDKNIIEHINDPLLHIIRNAVDHGIEMPDERAAKGKPERGTVLLEAKNTGGDVLIIIKDDGAGLNKEKIMQKAKANGLLRKPENEYTDKEIFQFINMPGFSTNDAVTAFSGRGVGMDVVMKNLEPIQGSVIVDSTPGVGSTFTMKIPLTMAIVEGMIIKIAGAKYTIPITAIKESFPAKLESIFNDPNGNEMITLRDKHYNIVRLHEFFGIPNAITNFEEGIMMLVENDSESVCLFLDVLVGEQQVVVKTLPKYINKVKGISGCTLLGNGDISLIIDIAGFFDK
jgi:two-component system chemotaxis sensor kinase CheA